MLGVIYGLTVGCIRMDFKGIHPSNASATTPLKIETLSSTSSASYTASQTVLLSLISRAIKLERFIGLNVVDRGRVLIRHFGLRRRHWWSERPRGGRCCTLETELTALLRKFSKHCVQPWYNSAVSIFDFWTTLHNSRFLCEERRFLL